ncbi:MAG: hypothetical protein ACMUIE_01880 [Thermoplasmatota archaeon]
MILIRRGALLVLLAVILPALSSIAGSQSLTSTPERIDQEKVIDHRITWGQTRDLGGGSYLRMDLETRASLLVIWGDRRNPAPITIVTRTNEVVGMEKLANGTFPIESGTVMGYRLESLVEFQDDNGNRAFDAPERSLNDSKQEGERIVKSCSLVAAWSIRHARPVQTPEGMEWTFTLSARNLTYKTFQNTSDVAVSTANTRKPFLEGIEFIFHLKVGKGEKMVLLQEHKLIEEGTEDRDLDKDVKQVERKLVNLNLSLKMDHHISGWDIDPRNRAPALMLKFSLHIGRTLDRDLVQDLWGNKKKALFGDPEIILSTEGDRDKKVWSEDVKEPVQVAGSVPGKGALDLRSRLGRLAGLKWTNDLISPSDAEKKTSGFQFLGISLIGPRDPLWSIPLIGSRTGIGLTVHGAYTYPGLSSLFHDPVIETSSWKVEERRVENGGSDDPLKDAILEEGGVPILIVIGIVAVLIVIAVVSSLTRRRYDLGDEELMREEEEEVFEVKARKRDWDKLRPK